ncbi:hypothetical protein BC834DRAFT_892175 [Gloeopeniophorella convolvens]|nr:hypothetical protein BC834DRAFT_892175 [Gloeopeniophorella convolvens]
MSSGSSGNPWGSDPWAKRQQTRRWPTPQPALASTIDIAWGIGNPGLRMQTPNPALCSPDPTLSASSAAPPQSPSSAASSSTLAQRESGEAKLTTPEEAAGINDRPARAVACAPAKVTDKPPNQAKGPPTEAGAEKLEPTPAPVGNAGDGAVPPFSPWLPNENSATLDASANVVKSTSSAQPAPEFQPTKDDVSALSDASQPPPVPKKSAAATVVAADAASAADQQAPSPAPKDEQVASQPSADTAQADEMPVPRWTIKVAQVAPDATDATTDGPVSRSTLRLDHLRMENGASSPSTLVDEVPLSAVEGIDDGEQGRKLSKNARKKLLRQKEKKAREAERSRPYIPRFTREGLVVLDKPPTNEGRADNGLIDDDGWD